LEVALKSGELADLERAIGYCFEDRALLVRSLTHSSLSKEASRASEDVSNEQMEFLGDSILGFLVSVVLVRQFPDYSEGQLSKLKAHLVSEAHLHQAALQLDLGRFLRLGRGEERSGGRAKRALLADALEALVAALYLDGGIEPARVFVGRWVLDEVDGREIRIEDYKSELQELLQARRAPQPRYVVVRERGPEHNKMFTVQVWIESERLSEAEGDSKKAAQQAAAKRALEKLREKAFDIEGRKTS
jgi:ribonuclease III